MKITSQTGRDRDMTEVFNAFFASIFNTDDGPRRPQCSELEDPDCENEQFPFNPETAQDLLPQLDPYKSMGSDGNLSRILKKLAGVIAKPLLMIFELSWESGEVPADWKLVNVVPVFRQSKKEDPRRYWPVSLTLMPDKLMEIILGGIEKHLKDNTVMWSQHEI
ncbi:hypothetical protein DUI87_18029 [Hirundo rustica rustica]|uniref:Reverse transcriptase domain-containing protein n=1 Tax=Hirundo rustica rustica TaxID=333673 RepID=A0A3M0JVT9_HIRRU|nr:hypothetical protein DUI87_18029 [Hirundo rustica rustica]